MIVRRQGRKDGQAVRIGDCLEKRRRGFKVPPHKLRRRTTALHCHVPMLVLISTPVNTEDAASVVTPSEHDVAASVLSSGRFSRLEVAN
jgi:hypothetical protein